MTTKTKTIIGAVAAIIALLIVGAVFDAPAPEPAATTAAPETTSTSTSTSTEADEFLTWAQSRDGEFTVLSDSLNDISAAIDAGDISRAADISEQVGNAYMELYLDAPSTGTALSEVGNKMLFDCALAYDIGAMSLRAMDPDQIDAAVVMINDCVELIGEASALVES